MIKQLLLIALVFFIIGQSSVFSDNSAKQFEIVIYRFLTDENAVNKSLASNIPRMLFTELVKDERFVPLEREAIAYILKDEIFVETLKTGDTTKSKEPSSLTKAKYSLIGRIYIQDKCTLVSASIIDNKTSKSICGETFDWNAEPNVSPIQKIKSLVNALTRQIPYPQKAGHLKVEIDPPDATIRISDNLAEYKPPLDLTLSKGEYTIYIKPNEPQLYRDYYKNVIVNEDPPSPYKIALERRYGTLACKYVPDSAALYIDGQYYSNKKSMEKSSDENTRNLLNNATYRMTSGEHFVSVVLQNGQLYQKTIFINPDEENELDLDFPNSSFFGNKVAPIINRSFFPITRADYLVLNTDLVLSVDQHGTLRAINAYDHHIKWVFSEFYVVSKPIVAGGKLFTICNTDGGYSLVEHSLDNGRILWESDNYKERGIIKTFNNSSALIIFENKIVFNIGPGSKIPQKIKLQKIKFEVDWGSAAISDSQLYASNKNGRDIYAFTLPGLEFLWKRSFEYKINSYLIQDESIVILFNYNALCLLSSRLGKELWRLDLPFLYAEHIQIRGEQGYVISSSGDFAKIGMTKGKLLLYRKNIFQAGVIDKFLVDHYGRLLILISNIYLFLYDPEVGANIWMMQPEKRTDIVLACDDYIVLTTNSGEVITIGNANTNNLSILGWIEDVDDKNHKLFIRATTNFARNNKDLFIAGISDLINRSIRSSPATIELAGFSQIDSTMFQANYNSTSNIIKKGFLLVPKGGINVTLTEKRACSCFVDGLYYGKSADILIRLKKGIHNITILASGYEVFSSKVQIGDDFSIINQSSLKPILNCCLNIETIPKNAEISINNEICGYGYYSIYNLHIGQIVEIRIRAEGCIPITDRVIISRDNEKRKYELRYILNDLLISFGFKSGSIPLITGWETPNLTRSGPINSPNITRPRGIGFMNFFGQFSPNNIGLDRFSIFFDLLIPINISLMPAGLGSNISYGINYFLGRLPIIGETSFGLSDESIHLELPIIRQVNIYRSALNYTNVKVGFRPTWWSAIDFTIGFLQNNKLQGTPYDDDGTGKYIYNQELSYSLNASSGHCYGMNASFDLNKIKIPVRFVFNIKYLKNNFNITSEQGYIYSISLGIGNKIMSLL